MNVEQILKTKGGQVVSAVPGDSLEKIAATLDQHRIGVVVILDETQSLAGILSERDLVRAFAKAGAKTGELPASEFMTTKLFTCAPSDSVNQIMNVMTENRIRHLPVIHDGELRGLISIGDVVKQRIAEIEFEAEEMKRFIAG